MFVTAIVIQMCDYLEVNIFMTQNNMLPSSKINFYFATFPRIGSMMYLVNIVTHIQMN